MTNTKISSAIGFDGGGYEDASGPSASIHFSYKAGKRLAVLLTMTQLGKKERRRRRRSQEENGFETGKHIVLAIPEVIYLFTRRRGANTAPTQMGRPTHEAPTREYTLCVTRCSAS